MASVAGKRIADGGDRARKLEEEERMMAQAAARLRPFLTDSEWREFSGNMRQADPDFKVSAHAAQSPRNALYYLSDPQWTSFGLASSDGKGLMAQVGAGLDHLMLPEEEGGLPEEWLDADEWRLRKI